MHGATSRTGCVIKCNRTPRYGVCGLSLCGKRVAFCILVGDGLRFSHAAKQQNTAGRDALRYSLFFGLFFACRSPRLHFCVRPIGYRRHGWHLLRRQLLLFRHKITSRSVCAHRKRFIRAAAYSSRSPRKNAISSGRSLCKISPQPMWKPSPLSEPSTKRQGWPKWSVSSPTSQISVLCR